MKNNFFVLLCVFLAACSSSTLRFKVTGVGDEFCVPTTGYVSPGVWFVPDNAPGAPNGFSFGGCHRLLKESDRATCTLPRDFISADVSSLQERRSQKWSDLKTSADYEMMISQPGAEYSIDVATNMLILSNPSTSQTWSILAHAFGHAGFEGTPTMHDDDVLVATCSKIEDFPRSAGLGTSGEYGCSRYVRGKHYALEYRFISKQRIPTEAQMKALESALFNQIDQWQCSK